MSTRRPHVRSVTAAFVVLALVLTAQPAAAGPPGPVPTATTPGTEIVGGSQAAAGEFPYQVALLTHGVADTFNAQFCGGSIISPTAILTAAHCVENEQPAGVDVLADTVRLGNGSGQRVRATRIHLHPRWNTRTSANDAAIVEVATALIPAPVSIVQPGQEALFAPGTDAVVTGWGALSEGGSYPDRLRKVTVPMTSDAGCRSAYGGGFEATNMVCAGAPQGGKDSCQGDSGGPLAVRAGAQWVQVGVVSWGDGCARPGTPGVYARLAALSPFVAPFTGSASHPYLDVPSWLTEAVVWMNDNGHMDGFADRTFRPHGDLTRAQAVRLLWRSAGEPVAASDPGFTDVPPWVVPATQWAATDPDGNGPAGPIVDGYEDGTFRPDQPVSRGQWTRMLHRAEGAPPASAPHAFADVRPWLDDAVAWITDPVRSPRFAEGFSDGTYRPTASVTRGQATRMVFRINAA